MIDPKQSNPAPTILITRPEKQARQLAHKLQEMGYRSFIEPLFDVQISKQQELDKINPLNLQAVLISSANALPFLAHSTIPKTTPLLVIGQETKAQAIKLGYSKVSSATNSATSLNELACKLLSQQKGLVLYLAGELITYDLTQALTAQGFTAQKIIAYKTVEKTFLSEELQKLIKNREIKIASLYSQNTALILYRLLVKHNLLEYFIKARLLCFSVKISRYCAKLGFQNIGLINELFET